MVALAVRTRVSTGLSIIFASKPLSLSTTSSVCVSLTLRVSSLMSPSVWVSLIESPGFRKSKLWRMPGRLRIAARSDLLSAMRRKMASSVSFLPTTTSMMEATLAC